MPTRSDRHRINSAGLILLLVSMAAWSEPPRTISMAPHLTELAFAAGVGEHLVGVVDWSDYPPEALQLPSIGDAFRFDLERIIELDPDLALAWRGGTPAGVVQRLEELGIEVLWVKTQTLFGIGEALLLIGQRMGNPEAGKQAAIAYRDQLESLIEGQPSLKHSLRVFYQVSPQPLYTFGRRHVINEVLEVCGMKNVFADLDMEAGVVDLEAVIATGPDLIIASRENNRQDPLRLWRTSTLIDSGNTSLHEVEPTILVRPTPRILEGIEHLCNLGQ
jgi:iron complex transport system substrate-binding protein